MAADLDIVMIDAEGLDLDIMGAFWERPGLRPVMMQFEWTWLWGDLIGAIQDLSRRGYRVHQDHQDMLGLLLG